MSSTTNAPAASRRRRTLLYIAGATIVILIAALLTWLFMPVGYDDYVPDQAKAVVRIDLTADRPTGSGNDQGKSPDKSKGNVDAPESLTALLKSLTGSADLPAGADYSRPLYAFITPNEYVGITLALDDRDAFAAYAAGLASRGAALAPEEIDGRHWQWLKSGWLMAWTRRGILILGPGLESERDVLRQTMNQLLDGSHPFTSTPAYDRLNASHSPLSLFATLDALPTPYNLLTRLGIPADTDPSAVALYATLAPGDRKAGDGETVVNCQLQSDNADILASIKRYQRQTPGLPASALTPADSALLYLATSVKGNDLTALFATDATMRGLLLGLDQAFDARKMLSTSSGLVTLEVGSLAKDWTPAFALKADNARPDLFAGASDWMASARRKSDVTLTRQGPEAFTLASSERTLIFGRQPGGRVIYFASPSMRSAALSPHGDGPADPRPDAPIVSVSIDVRRLFAQPALKGNAAGNLLRLLLPARDRLTYTARKGLTAEMRLR